MANEVYVLTKAKLLHKEEFVDVFSSLKALEKHLRKKVSPYVKQYDNKDSYIVDNNGDITLYFAHKKTVKD
ncbi:MAG: hypothetical protein WC189_04065 [Bacilli bacterium]